MVKLSYMIIFMVHSRNILEVELCVVEFAKAEAQAFRV